ncbi:MAG TPA: RHS repeat-associated core domain-containing protein, partial [Pirellula sp.]|nr:RHS repeat-associated core domain-containing protein [Pirellula sp.]
TNRGWLLNKRYMDGSGPDYGYTDVGKLAWRKWARMTNSTVIMTTYDYSNPFSQLESVTYNDGTPPVSYSYRRNGRLNTVIRNGMTTTFHYSAMGSPLGESYAGGALDGLAVTNNYNGLMQHSAVLVPGKITNLFAYNMAARVTNVSDGLNSATYSYVPNSPLISQIVFKSNTTTRMTTTKQYDFLNRLQSIRNVPSAGGSEPISTTYRYNEINQRTQARLESGEFWSYRYDSFGQVKSGKKRFEDSVPVPGQQFEYGFDSIGNRISTANGGDENGINLRSAAYTNNTLNQVTSRTNPNKIDLIGIATTDASVSINGSSSSIFRRETYFRKEQLLTNNTFPEIVVAASNGTVTNTVSGNNFVPPVLETFGYDLDGNRTNDGRWNLTWDAENRLVQMESKSDAPTNSYRKLVFDYDHLGRRIRKTVCENGSTTPTKNLKYIYDRWNLLAELNATNNAVVCSYVWGPDQSGTSQGYGGVGGLIAFRDSGGEAHYAGYDGRGNVSVLVKSSTGNVSGEYEYGPFGEVIKVSSSTAELNPFRFSTRYYDTEVNMIYYAFRYLDYTSGRWLNRDPIEESGGINLYIGLKNDGINRFDPWGKSNVNDPPSIRPNGEVYYDISKPFQWHHPITYLHSSFEFQSHPLVKLACVDLKLEQRLIALQNHASRHSEPYHIEVGRRLDAKFRALGGNASAEDALAAFNEVVDEIVEDIKNKRLPPYSNKQVVAIPDEVAAAIKPDRYGYVRRLEASKKISNSAGKALVVINIFEVANALAFRHQHPNARLDRSGDIYDPDTGKWYDGNMGYELTLDEMLDRGRII